MRFPSVLLLPAASACLVLALAGCAGGESDAGTAGATASSVASDAVELAGTTWRVTDAAGAASGTTVHFDGTSVTVSAGDRSSSYAWTAQGDQVLVGGGSSALTGPVDARWLTGTVRVRHDGDGWLLLGADGSPTARLTARRSASPAPTTPTDLLRSATPAPVDAGISAAAIEGRWIVAGSPSTAITFTHGDWTASSSCTTGAVGGRGVYRVLPGGGLLVVRTATPMRGCPIVAGEPHLRPNAITAIARAASFRVSADTLRLFDRSGAPLGSLVRG